MLEPLAKRGPRLVRSLRRRMLALSGPSDEPSPSTSSVTPCRMSLCDLPSRRNALAVQLSMLMNPGETARPSASMIVLPRNSADAPKYEIRSPRMATIPTNGAPPLPS